MITDGIDLEVAKADGILTIDNVAMQCPAWAVLNVNLLWGPADQRGEDLLIPGRPGRLPNPRRIDATKVQLRMVIDGRVDRTGAPWPQGEREGLRRNLLFLRTNVTDPTNVGDGTRTARLATPDRALTLTGAVTVENLRLGDRVGPLWKALLELSIPAGVLA